MRLSIAMIVKNEEKNLDRTLKALEPLKGKLSHEIVIVDTGSTDSTIEIAKRYTNRVYEHPWTGNFGEMRNISINYCKGEWILILDADEVVDDVETIIDFFKSGDCNKYMSAEISLKNMLDDNPNNYLLATLFRLFKNHKEFYYEGRIHEQPRVIKPYGKSKIFVTHYGYSREDYELMIYKHKRNEEILLKDLEEGIEPIYTRFQLAQTYSMANMHKEAFNIIKEAYNIMKQRKGYINFNVYHFYSRELTRIGNYEKALEVIKEVEPYCTTSLDIYYMFTCCYYNLKQYDKAIKYCKLYFDLRDKKEKGKLHTDPFKDGILIDFSFCRKNEMIKNYVVCLFETKRYEEVVNEFKKAEDKELIKVLEELYIYSLLILKDYKQIREYYKEVDHEDIEVIRKVLVILNNKGEDIDINEVVKELLGIDKILDCFINYVYLNNNIEVDFEELDFSDYYSWKGIIFRHILPHNENALDYIENLNDGLINNYIASSIDDYDCLKIYFNYSKDKFLTNKLNDLVLLNTLEKNLLGSICIDKSKYKGLVFRALINKYNYITKIYKEEVINSNEVEKHMDTYSSTVVRIIKLIKGCHKDKLSYVKGLRLIIDEVNDFKNIIEVLKDDIDTTVISESMINEKEVVLKEVEAMVGQGQTVQALEVLEQLDKIFMFDPKILMTKGVVLYLLNRIDDAILDLAIANLIEEDNFEIVYNLACVLEIYNKEASKYYYEKAINLSTNDEMIEQIKCILEAI